MNFYYTAQIDILKTIGTVNPENSTKADFIGYYEDYAGVWLIYKSFAYLIPRSVLFIDHTKFKNLGRRPVSPVSDIDISELALVKPTGVMYKAGKVKYEEFSRDDIKVYYNEKDLRRFPGGIDIYVQESSPKSPAVITDGMGMVLGAIAPIIRPNQIK